MQALQKEALCVGFLGEVGLPSSPLGAVVSDLNREECVIMLRACFLD